MEDERWQKEYDFALQQYSDSKSSGGSTGASSGGGGGSGGGSYDNGTLKEKEVIALQKALGVAQDGKYGSVSKKAAGGLSAEEAYQKFVGDLDPQDVPEDDGLPKSMADVTATCNAMIAGGADKSQVGSYITSARLAGIITLAQERSLKSLMAPRGAAY